MSPLGENCYPAKVSTSPVAKAEAVCVPLAAGQGWSVSEFVCDLGPGDPAFQEQHDAPRLVAVTRGAFTYRSEYGASLLHAGSLLLGNRGACYQCGHEHVRGDRCLSARIAPELFAEAAATYASGSRYRFPVAMMPAGQAASVWAETLESARDGKNPPAFEVRLLRGLAYILIHLSGHSVEPLQVTAGEARRIARVLELLECEAQEPLSLDRMASVAAMSKFHFLRVFRRVLGHTPHRFLMIARLNKAATRLRSSRDGVAEIAFEAGFGDLSSFNAAFRAQYGFCPTAYRRGQRSVFGAAAPPASKNANRTQGLPATRKSGSKAAV